jgi:hypothetical protein
VAAGKPNKEKAEALRAEASNPPAEPLSTDMSGTLPAMRHVVSNPSSADRSHEQKSMRQWRETSPTTFYSRLSALEQAEASG